MQNKELETKTPLLFIEVTVAKQLQTHAFLDTGADGNTISHELYACLKDIALQSTKTQFQAYTGHRALAFGICELNVLIQGLTCGDEFFVTQPKL